MGGQYPEDREFYEGQTELALRIGTRGAIAHFSPNRPCCLISRTCKSQETVFMFIIGKNSQSNKFLLTSKSVSDSKKNHRWRN